MAEPRRVTFYGFEGIHQRCDQGGRGFNQATFASAGRASSNPDGLGLCREGSILLSDGHRLVDRLEIWEVVVDDFLRQLNLVSR